MNEFRDSIHCRRNSSMSKRVVNSVIGKCCPICLNQVRIPSAAVIIPCMHAYCFGCISKWSCLKRTCPVCNGSFSSWFCKINPFDERFSEHKVLPPALGKGKPIYSSDRDRLNELLRRRRAQRERCGRQSQNKQFPSRRSFGLASLEGAGVIYERVKQWRASIYEKHLWAIPLSTKNGVIQKVLGRNGNREIILKKIEPWIRRELQVVLEDLDPTVIMHVATSIFISKHEKFESAHFRADDNDFLAPLRPFLHENTDLFWHELRCFAESSLSMEAYDRVVEYIKR